MEDEAIIALYVDRDERAIGETRTKYGRLIRSVAARLLPTDEDREECENDSYLALWNTIPPARPCPFVAYISRITRNIAISARRRMSADKRQGDPYAASLDELAEVISAPAIEEQFSAAELGRAIDRFLAEAGKDNRVLFLRRYYFGESVGELAAEMRMNENAVSARISRMRKQLSAYLIKEGFTV